MSYHEKSDDDVADTVRGICNSGHSSGIEQAVRQNIGYPDEWMLSRMTEFYGGKISHAVYLRLPSGSSRFIV